MPHMHWPLMLAVLYLPRTIHMNLPYVPLLTCIYQACKIHTNNNWYNQLYLD
jgi:hypothetical protein